MKYSIDISEELINKLFLDILPMTDHDEILFKGNNALVLRPKELEEINSYLEVGENGGGEDVWEIVERAIDKSSIDLYNYEMPSKIRLVKDKNPNLD
jgi:hypothetical protein